MSYPLGTLWLSHVHFFAKCFHLKDTLLFLTGLLIYLSVIAAAMSVLFYIVSFSSLFDSFMVRKSCMFLAISYYPWAVFPPSINLKDSRNIPVEFLLLPRKIIYYFFCCCFFKLVFIKIISKHDFDHLHLYLFIYLLFPKSYLKDGQFNLIGQIPEQR